jgi:hypothetical protein
MIPPDLVQHLQETFLGKKISVENDKGKWSGVCQFIGSNPFFPSWGLQVTLDRTPVTNVKLKSIQLYDKVIQER